MEIQSSHINDSKKKVKSLGKNNKTPLSFHYESSQDENTSSSSKKMSKKRKLEHREDSFNKKRKSDNSDSTSSSDVDVFSKKIEKKQKNKIEARIDTLESLYSLMAPKLFYKDNEIDVLTLGGKNVNLYAIELAKHMHGDALKNMVLTSKSKKSINSDNNPWSQEDVSFFSKAVKKYDH